MSSEAHAAFCSAFLSITAKTQVVQEAQGKFSITLVIHPSPDRLPGFFQIYY